MTSVSDPRAAPILVTGATGYVGGRLVPRLLAAGHRVRVMVRDPARLKGRSWRDEVEVVRGDVHDPTSLPPALDGASAAYYLVHSMSGGGDFHRRDLVAAGAFGDAAKTAGVRRLIYLGGLGDPDADLSEHLRSRHETGRALAAAGVPVTEFRAGIVVGSGSLSFEMIRNLTERLPMMICPRWIYTRTQPVAIRDVLAYLEGALTTPASTGRIIEIGGEDVLSYGDMMHVYAKVRGLRRLLVPVPVLTPRLSSYWVHWMTPVSAEIARPLIEGLRSEVVVIDPEPARTLFPEVRPIGYEEAVQRALRRIEERHIETTWSDALHSSLGDEKPVVLALREGIVIDRRQIRCSAPPDEVYGVYTGLGGKRGWLATDWAWRLRGAVDRLLGGVGMRRGRRDPDELRVGDALDFWRVEALEPGRLMRLRAEMKVPGPAWLEFKSDPAEEGGTVVTMTAFFGPRGLSGLVYWYSMQPAHAVIFRSLIRRVGRLADERADERADAASPASRA